MEAGPGQNHDKIMVAVSVGFRFRSRLFDFFLVLDPVFQSKFGFGPCNV